MKATKATKTDASQCHNPQDYGHQGQYHQRHIVGASLYYPWRSISMGASVHRGLSSTLTKTPVPTGVRPTRRSRRQDLALSSPASILDRSYPCVLRGLLLERWRWVPGPEQNDDCPTNYSWPAYTTWKFISRTLAGISSGPMAVLGSIHLVPFTPDLVRAYWRLHAAMGSTPRVVNVTGPLKEKSIGFASGSQSAS
jgi:hypothetical protein